MHLLVGCSERIKGLIARSVERVSRVFFQVDFGKKKIPGFVFDAEAEFRRETRVMSSLLGQCLLNATPQRQGTGPSLIP